MATNHSPSPSPSNSPNKRLKTLLPDSGINLKIDENELEGEQQKEEEKMSGGESLRRCCGICLCEENGNGIRGQIDSCDHYFCFVCIMEWAKVESRCPMCKRRFTTICRPPKPGVFPSQRLVNVPKRDQVFHLFGNTTIEPFDPYAQVQCSECHTAVDECLLLLCDLCDSAAHTYCVGLGATVPEGDWFCHDCALSRTQHGNIQKDGEDVTGNLNVKFQVMLAAEPHVSMSDAGADANCQNTSENCNARAMNEAKVSIFDSVRDTDDPFIGRSRARFSPVSSPCQRQSNPEDVRSMPRERTPPIGPGQQTLQSDARTLSRCRNVHSYIRALRENWDALRSGSLRFSSSSVESRGKSIAKCNTLAVTEDSSGQSHSLTSRASQQLTTNDGLPSIFAQDKHSQDAKKAWKMMARAKSIQQACRRSKTVHCVSKNALRNAFGEATGGCSSLQLLRSQQCETSRLGSLTVEQQYQLYSPEKQTERHTSSKLKMQSQSLILAKEIVGSSDNPPTTLPRSSASMSSSMVQTSSQSIHENQEWVLQQNLCRASLKATNQQIGSGRLMPLVGSVSETSESLNTKADFGASFSCKVNIPKEDVRLEKSCTEIKERNNDNAKSEIQSLVKLNLKLLKGDKQLGVDAFKEVARLATHTILAACGFERSRHIFHSVPRSICSHPEGIQQLRKSTLMPNSCRECFYVFVKDVVNSVLSGKASHSNSSKLIS